jgi:RNA polymerase sigma-B factor
MPPGARFHSTCRKEMGYEAVESQLAAGGADLDDRELLVLRLRFGRDLNQYEIGRRLGVSQMQISRIMRRALRKLLDAVQDDELRDELKDKSESV